MRSFAFVVLLMMVSACAQKNLLESQFSTQSIAATSPEQTANTTNIAVQDVQTNQHITQPITLNFPTCLASREIDGIPMTTLAHYLLGDAKSGQTINVGPAIMADYVRLVSEEVDLRGTTSLDVISRHRKFDKACFSAEIKRRAAKPTQVTSLRPGAAKIQTTASDGRGKNSYRRAIRSLEIIYGRIETVLKKADPDELPEHIARSFLPVTMNAPHTKISSRKLP